MKTKTLIVDLEAYNTVVPPVRIPSAQPTRHCEPPAVAPHTTKFAGATNLFQCDEKLDFESDGTGSSNPLRSTNESVRTAGVHAAYGALQPWLRRAEAAASLTYLTALSTDG